VRTVKRKNEAIMAQLGNSQQAIQAGTLVNQHGVNLSAQESQALIVMTQELKSEKYNHQRTIKKLRSTIAQYDEPNETMEARETPMNINSLVDAALATIDVGSTIMIDTRKYISLVLSQPCETCGEANPLNKKSNLTCPTGFAVQCRVTCTACNGTTSHSNESEKVNFAMCAAAAGLVGGINRNALARVFGMMGITKQPGKTSFHNYQDRLIQPICKAAKKSAANALEQVITYLKSSNQITMAVSFDVSWSHVRNAKEASGEFIFQGKIPGKKNCNF